MTESRPTSDRSTSCACGPQVRQIEVGRILAQRCSANHTRSLPLPSRLVPSHGYWPIEPSTQFGMPSDIAIDGNGKIYVADSECGSGAEAITVDRQGNIFAGEPRPQRLLKYVKVR